MVTVDLPSFILGATIAASIYQAVKGHSLRDLPKLFSVNVEEDTK